MTQLIEWKISNKLIDYDFAISEMEKRVLGIKKNSDKELVWLLEHKSIFTAGTSAKNKDLLKDIIMNKKLSLEERFKAQQKLSKMPRNSAKTRVRNRCQITGRPHGVYRKLKISRIALRKLGLEGKIPGMVKSSW